jgi:hypothetical protein
MRVELPRTILLQLIAFIAAWSLGAKALAQTAQEARTTLVIFADHRLKDEVWTSLFEALRREQPVAAAKDPALRGGLSLVRGDTMARGLQVEKPITVYLHGDCTLLPAPRLMTAGALGWVFRSEGKISPFIHVDCSLIAQELGPLALGMSRERRCEAMGEAIARVIVHEWLHIATQSAKHSAQGVSKPAFSAADLLSEEEVWQHGGPKFVFAWKGLR